MIRKIILFVIGAIIVLLALMWILSGGISRAVATAKTYPNFANWMFGVGASGSNTFVLPNQPKFPQVPLIGNATTTDTEAQLLELQLQYNTLRLKEQAAQAGVVDTTENQ